MQKALTSFFKTNALRLEIITKPGMAVEFQIKEFCEKNNIKYVVVPNNGAITFDEMVASGDGVFARAYRDGCVCISDVSNTYLKEDEKVKLYKTVDSNSFCIDKDEETIFRNPSFRFIGIKKN